MALLSRAVRFCVEPDAGADGPNGFGGRPPMRSLGAFYEIRVDCAGEPDEATGYLVDIGDIDRAVRSVAPPMIREALFGERERVEPGALLVRIAGALRRSPGPVRVARVRWMLTPTYSLEVEADQMDQPTPRIRIRQAFEFAAAHRLHVPEYSAEENRRLFGKCNNPSGHGHNYRVEAEVETALRDGRADFTLADLEEAVDRAILQRFDHKHLNLDTEEFRDRNPSVERIAQACFDRLRETIDPDRATLRSVTVWETSKTCATCTA